MLFDGIAVFVIGTVIWHYSLTQRANFHEVVSKLDNNTIIQLQDRLKCCGYFNSTDLAVVGGNFCANSTFVEVTNNATSNFCVGPLTSYTDYTLNNLFTSVYGFMAIVISLILLTLCVINEVRYLFTQIVRSDWICPDWILLYFINRERRKSVSGRSTRSAVVVDSSKAGNRNSRKGRSGNVERKFTRQLAMARSFF